MIRRFRYQHFEICRHADGTPWILGHGAMGITCKAIDTNLLCDVALKLIRPELLDDEKIRERFLREARAAAAIRHPNVATVLHLGEEEGEYFFAMEFAEGMSVDERLRLKGAFPAPLALEVALQTCRALGAAFRAGLVHRDIKPSNIMLTKSREEELVVKLIDFGLARPEDHNDRLDASMASGFRGTPFYASPEQIHGGQPDIRSDIYSLGVTLFAMLTGHAPFSGSLAQVLSGHLNTEPPLHALPAAPADLPRLLGRMLAKDPAHRYQSPAQLRSALEAARASLNRRTEPRPTAGNPPARAASQPPPLRPRREKSRSPKWLYTGLASGGALALLLLAAMLARSPQKPAIKKSEPVVPMVPAASRADSGYLDAARECKARDDYGGALENYSLALDQNPESAEPLRQMEMIAAYLRSNASPLTPASLAALRAPLTRAAERGVVSAQMLLGEQLRSREPAEALQWFKAAAAQGQTEAMTQAGLMVASGAGVEHPDLPAAVALFQKGTSGGETDAMVSLAECFLYGKGTAKNKNRAAELLRTAAALNHPMAMNMLGDIYARGELGPPDFAKAFELFSQASRTGYLDAQANLGVLHANGQGVPQDRSRALSLWKDGAERGNAVCMFYYAKALESGLDGRAQPAAARQWYVRSAELGNRSAIQWCRQQGIPLPSR